MKIFFIAGEPSGDQHASHIIRRLHEDQAGTECFGLGGSAMQAAGFETLLPFGQFNRMGFVESLSHLFFFLNAERYLARAMQARRPDVVVLVDYYGFNVRMLRHARRLRIPVVWYIPPKVWAWNAKRAAVLSQNCDCIATIFPFENRWFEGGRAQVRFVGNPLIEALDREHPDRLNRFVQPPEAEQTINLAIIPGSRYQEVANMLEPMVKAYLIVKKAYSGLTATVSKCPWLPEELFAPFEGTPELKFASAPLSEILSWSHLAVVTSGTATLETALAGIPHVIAYRTSAISYWIVQALIKVDYVGLPNIVAERSVVPEILQKAMTPRRLAFELRRFLDEPARFLKTRDALVALRGKLGSKQPSPEVARLILETASVR
jgi:lipid-A-disaccharide synthase